MASPVADVYTAPAGAVLCAGRYPAGSVIAAGVAEALSVSDGATSSVAQPPLEGGVVTTLGTQTLAAFALTVYAALAEGQSAAVARMGSPSGLTSFCSAVIWRGKYTLPINGGHTDSYDDGFYAQDLLTGAWSCPLPPSTLGSAALQADASGEYGISGRPAAQHTHCTHIQTVGDDIILGATESAGVGPSGTQQAHRWRGSLNAGAGGWERYGTATGTRHAQPHAVHHDTLRSRFVRFTLVGNVSDVQVIADDNSAADWTEIALPGSTPTDIYAMGIGYHPGLDCYALVDQNAVAAQGRVWVMDAADIAGGWAEVTVGGITPPAMSTGGIEYVPPMGAFALCCMAEPTALYYLTPQGSTRLGAWAYSKEVFTGSTIAAWAGSGGGALDPCQRLRWADELMALVVLKAAHVLTEVWKPSAVAAFDAWTARAAGAVAAVRDFTDAPANGGDWKWGSLQASPKTTLFSQNQDYYPYARQVDHAIAPPGSRSSLRWDVEDTPSGQTLVFTASVAGATSGTLELPFVSALGNPVSAVFSDGTARSVTISGTSVTWTGALPSGTPILSMNLPDLGAGERGDLWWISLDDYADQFDGDTANNEFWVQWRTRMDETYATFAFLDRQTVPAPTAYKQLMIGEGMQPTMIGVNPAWPHGYEGPGTSQAQNHIAYARVDFEGETNVVGIYGSDGTYPAGFGFKYPSTYHGKPGYLSLVTKGQDNSYYTHRNAGDEGVHAAACEYQIGGVGYTDKSTCFQYPVDQWFTLMVHVILGPRGHALSSLANSTRNVAATRVDATHILLAAGDYTEHFRGDTAAPTHVEIRGATTGTVDAVITNKDTTTFPGQALLTLASLSSPVQAEALTVDEHENGFTGSTIEYWGAQPSGAMQLLHRRTGVVMRVGNYPNELAYTATARYGTFAWTTFMTSKSLTQTHPVASVWVGQIIVKGGPTAPATPA